MIKKVIIITILALWAFVYAKEEEPNNKYVIGWTTSETDTIYGVGLCMVRFKDERNTINGADIQIIGGNFLPLFLEIYKYGWNFYDNPSSRMESINNYKAYASDKSDQTNGIAVSLFGNTIKKLNGLSLGGLASLNIELNGVSINPFQNNIFQLNGLAIGVLNGSYEMTGCQIGIWNRGNIVHGAQLGVLVNHADEINGLQLGLINYTDILNGCQIGLFNFYHNQNVKQDEMSFRVGWPIINWKF